MIVKPMDRFTALVQDTKLGDGLRLVSVFQGVLEVVAAAIQTLFIHQLSIKVHIQFEHWRFRLLEKKEFMPCPTRFIFLLK